MIGVSNVTNRMDPSSLRSRVFVGNLNTLHLQKSDLETIFSKYGNIIGISIHKGYAFVQYSNEMHARTAACGEDGNIYFGMKIDVTIASEPKNRKRGRSAVTPVSGNQQSLVDLALHTQALAAIGGQLSQLGFINNPNNAPVISPASASSNLNSLFGSPVMNPTGKPSNSLSYRSLNHRSHQQAPSCSSSAKRTRLESSFAGSLQSTSNSGTTRHGNLIPLVANKSSSDSSTSTSSKVVVDPIDPKPIDPVISPGISGNNLVSIKEADDSVDGHYVGSNDILICGQCRRLFNSIEALISHKSKGCSTNTTCCRCKAEGEPEFLYCASCGDSFSNAWGLISHCQNIHALTIYVLPSNDSLRTPSSQPGELESGSSSSSSSPSSQTSLPQQPFSNNSILVQPEEIGEDPPTPLQLEICEELNEKENSSDEDEGILMEEKKLTNHRRASDHEHHEASQSGEYSGDDVEKSDLGS